MSSEPRETDVDSRFALPVESVSRYLQPLFLLGFDLPEDVGCDVLHTDDLKGLRLADYDFYQIFPTNTLKDVHWIGDTPIALEQLHLTRVQHRVCVMVDNPSGKPYPVRVDEYLTRTDGEPYLLAFLRPDASDHNTARIGYFSRQHAIGNDSNSVEVVFEGQATYEDEDEDNDRRKEAAIVVKSLYKEMRKRREEAEGGFQDRFAARILKDFGDAVDDGTRSGYQAVTLRTIGEMVGYDGKRKLYIHAPPRFGKTYLASKLIEHANEVSDPIDVIIYVTLTQLALEDVERDLQHRWSETYGARAQLPYARWYARKDKIYPYTRVLLTSYDSFANALTALKDLHRNTRVVILDEGHAAAGVRKTIQYVDSGDFVTVALTATPTGRMNSLENLGFEQALRITPLEQIEAGISPPVRIKRYVTEVTPETHQALVEGGFQMTVQKLNRLLEDTVYLQTVVTRTIELATNKDMDGNITFFKRTFLQAISIHQAEAMVHQLHDNPYTSHLADRIGLIHSGFTHAHNRRTLEAYRRGEIDVIVGINIIKQSLHLPGLEVIFPTPTLSPIHIGQTVGRGMNNDKPELLIVEIFHSEWPEALGYQTTPQFLGLTDYTFGTLIKGHDTKRYKNEKKIDEKIPKLSPDLNTMVNSTSREVDQFSTFDRRLLALYEHVRTPADLFALYREFRAANPESVNFVESLLQTYGIWRGVFEQLILQWIEADKLPSDAWVVLKGSTMENSLDGYFSILYAIESRDNQYAAWLHEQFLPDFESMMDQGRFPSIVNSLHAIEESITTFIQNKEIIRQALLEHHVHHNKQSRPSYGLRRAVRMYLSSSEEGIVLKEWIMSIRVTINSVYIPREIQSQLSTLYKRTNFHVEDYIGEAIYQREDHSRAGDGGVSLAS